MNSFQCDLVLQNDTEVYIGWALWFQHQKCVWQADLSGGSVFSSPCLAMDPHQIYVGTLSGFVCAIQPVSTQSAIQSMSMQSAIQPMRTLSEKSMMCRCRLVVVQQPFDSILGFVNFPWVRK